MCFIIMKNSTVYCLGFIWNDKGTFKTVVAALEKRIVKKDLWVNLTPFDMLHNIRLSCPKSKVYYLHGMITSSFWLYTFIGFICRLFWLFQIIWWPIEINGKSYSVKKDRSSYNCIGTRWFGLVGNLHPSHGHSQCIKNLLLTRTVL